MGKFLSRTAAASLLGCTAQTVSNYAKAGMIDEIQRNTKGRVSLYYDEDQLKALMPDLTQLKNLKKRIKQEREALHNELSELIAVKKANHQQLLLYTHGEKTWRKYQELVKGAYIFAAGEDAEFDNTTDAIILRALLNLEDIDMISRITGASMASINGVIARMVRKMAKLEGIDALYREVAELRADNRRLRMYNKEESARIDEKRQEAIQTAIENLPGAESLSVFSLGLSIRANNIFREMDIKTIPELVTLSRRRLMMARGAGRKTVDEIEEALHKRGLHLTEV